VIAIRVTDPYRGLADGLRSLRDYKKRSTKQQQGTGGSASLGAAVKYEAGSCRILNTFQKTRSI